MEKKLHDPNRAGINWGSINLQQKNRERGRRQYGTVNFNNLKVLELGQNWPLKNGTTAKEA